MTAVKQGDVVMPREAGYVARKYNLAGERKLAIMGCVPN
jgi:hypothetical protein